MKKPYKLRAVQLDLARQMETPEYIRSFIDFIKEYGYNALVLYLEGRIKTPSFPYPADKESYTACQMKEIVRYAGKRGIDVIPVISSFGHAELFLQYKELCGMAELRDGGQGRFSSGLQAFCPSLEKTYDFFRRYFSEIAAIFPSEYFHAGCDEIWDIGFCPLCRKRLEEGETQSELFGKHLIRTREIITEDLHKKMVIWDDMFELYPDALNMLPRDIILCMWKYDTSIERPESHFGYRFREDRLALYKKKGFEYIVAPRESHPLNTESLFKYAHKYEPIGGLMTIWEKSGSFILSDYPNIAFAGMLWKNGDPEKAGSIYADVCRRIFQVEDKAFIMNIIATKYLGEWRETVHPEEFLYSSMTKYFFGRTRVSEVLLKAITAGSSRVKVSIGRSVIEDMILALEREILQHDLKSYVHDLCDCISGKIPFSSKKRSSSNKALLEKIKNIRRKRAVQWAKFRSGIVPVHTDVLYDAMYSEFNAWAKEEEIKCNRYSILTIKYFLPDYHGSQRVALILKTSGRSGWKRVFSGVPKPDFQDPEQVPYFVHTHIILSAGTPERLRIETSGYGGIGIVFVEFTTRKKRFVPVSVDKCEGKIENPETVLLDNSEWCYLGEKKISRYFRAMPAASKKSSFELTFRSDSL